MLNLSVTLLDLDSFLPRSLTIGETLQIQIYH